MYGQKVDYSFRSYQLLRGLVFVDPEVEKSKDKKRRPRSQKKSRSELSEHMEESEYVLISLICIVLILDDWATDPRRASR